jgi:hypothetical protein
MFRICNKCGICKELNIENFSQVFGRGKKKLYFKNKCKECHKIYSRDYNREHKEKCRKNLKEYLEKNPFYQKECREKNKEHYLQYRRLYEKRPNIKLKKRISKAIKKALNKVGSKKQIETLKFLEYSIEELKIHLENQFEQWMNWDNWGVYLVSEWDDNDSSTWKWQIDHIIPMATFEYTCELDDSFKRAWSLNNLRPLNAKENVIRGARMYKTSRSKITEEI